MVASGVESVRAVFDWSRMQPYKDWNSVPPSQRGDYVDVNGRPTNFAWTDELVSAASARGLTIDPVILGAPKWDGQSYKGGIVDLPRSDGPYAQFAAGLVERYGPTGSFWATFPTLTPVPITRWQVWNEPNIPAFWPPQPFQQRYVALLKAAHDAIKTVDPSAQIVLAGLPNYAWVALARIYKVKGARSLFDIVAVHPYTRTPRNVITILTYVRRAMDKAGDRDKPMLADEISWPSSVGKTTHTTGFDFATTEQGQAQNIAQLLPMLVKDRKRLGLAGFYYYDWAGLSAPASSPSSSPACSASPTAASRRSRRYGAYTQAVLAMEGCKSKGRSRALRQVAALTGAGTWRRDAAPPAACSPWRTRSRRASCRRRAARSRTSPGCWTDRAPA